MTLGGVGVRPLVSAGAALSRLSAGTAAGAVALAALVVFGMARGEFASFVVGIGFVEIVAVLGLHLLVNDAGQYSLAHGAFVAVGAFVAAHAAGALGADLGVLAIVPAALAGAAAAAVVALPVLRLAGFAAAITTWLFAVAADRYLFAQTWFVRSQAGVDVAPLEIGPLALRTARAQLLFVALAAGVAIAVTAAVRRSRFGRSLLAVRSNEAMAAAAGVDVRATKVAAFAVAGAFAGAAGALHTVLLGRAVPSSFPPFLSVTLLAIVLVGGRGALGGPVATALLFASAPQLLGGLGRPLQYASALGVIVVLAQFPGGMNEQVRHLSHGITHALARRRGATHAEPTPPTNLPPALSHARGVAASSDRAGGRAAAGTALEVRDAVVRFGGLAAVDGVSLAVERGEILGLIGPNGAGKTTLVNAIAGAVALEAGSVLLDGDDVSGLGAHRRARRGLRRTFQYGGLVPDETVMTNLLIAQHAAGRVGDFAALEQAHVLLDEVGAAHLAGARVADLPAGSARLVEVACALAVDPAVLLLDEPSSGLTPDEIERLTDVLVSHERRTGCATVVVAHDMRFVMALVSRVVVMAEGRVIAEGSPAQVRRDRAVRTLYLGSAA